jgi:hypothetical protein
MCASPLPENAIMCTTSDGTVYFKDLMEKIATFEHPLNVRFRMVLDRERLDQITLRSSRQSLESLFGDYPESARFDTRVRVSHMCADCRLMESTKMCLVCLESRCDFCFDSLHTVSSTRSNHAWIPTPAGSRCVNGDCKNRPRIYCEDCQTPLCMDCFVDTHNQSDPQHRCIYLETILSNAACDVKQCSECGDTMGYLSCDYCRENFCVECFRTIHSNSGMREHTCSTRIISPTCMHCRDTRATLFCEDCYELFCSKCFATMHAHGNRYFHNFTDAGNVLLLIEKLDPDFQELLKSSRVTNLNRIVLIQRVIRGFLARRRIKRLGLLATHIQKMWRGYRSRDKHKRRSRVEEPAKLKKETRRSFTSRLRSLSRSKAN